MPIVDAHPHIYSPDRERFPTIEVPWEPGEPASAEDLKQKMDAAGVDRAVFIQTSTFYGFDNRYIMEASGQFSEWACGVVTLNPDDPSHVEVLEEGVAEHNIRGMRGIADSINRVTSPNVYRLWSKAMELGIPVNCMVMADLDRVPEIERIAQDLDSLRIVIDHCFMLNTNHRTEETLAALERLSAQPNIYAKLTPGTHGSYRVYPFPDMHDPLKRVIAAFGPERCVWGSNFPNALWSKGASYAQNLHLFVKELGLTLPEKAQILGTTALSLWFPDEHRELEQQERDNRSRTEQEAVRASEGDEPGDEEDAEDEADTRAGEVANITRLLADPESAAAADGPDGEEADPEGRPPDVSELLEAASELNSVMDRLAAQEQASKSPARRPGPGETDEQASA